MKVKKIKVKGKHYWDNGTLKYIKGFTFKIRTKGNASYGAWSPTYKSKKIRIR